MNFYCGTVLAVLAPALLVGCNDRTRSADAEFTASRARILQTLPQGWDQMTVNEQKAAQAAYSALERDAKAAGVEPPIVWRYEVKKEESGWCVWVNFVQGWFREEPIVGGFATVTLGQNFQVQRIMGGL